MATHIFKGDAAEIAEVQQFTVAGTWADGDIVTMNINGQKILVTFGGAIPTVSEVVAALVAAWNGAAITGFTETRNITGDLITEFNEITASDADPILTLTHDTKGIPFTVTITTDSSAGTISAVTVATPSQSPNHWIAENFDSGALPASTDTVHILDNDVSIKYGLDQNGVDLAKLVIRAGYTGEIGLPAINSDNTNSYREYRQRSLKIGAAILEIGAGEGSGSSRIQIDIDGQVCAATIFSTGSSAETDFHAVQLTNAAATSTLKVLGGSVDASAGAAETGEFTTIDVAGQGAYRGSSGVTWTTLNVSGNASADIDSDGTNLNTFESATLIKREGAITNANLFGSNHEWIGSGTIATTFKLGRGSVFDASQNVAGFTITPEGVISADCSIVDPAGKITWTAGVKGEGIGVQDFSWVTKKGATLVQS